MPKPAPGRRFAHITLAVPPDLAEAFKAAAASRDESMSQVIRRAMREYIGDDAPSAALAQVPGQLELDRAA